MSQATRALPLLTLDAVTTWLDGLTPWMVAGTLVAAVLALVLTALMYRRERRKRPHGMPGEWHDRYKGKNIYWNPGPVGYGEFYVEHNPRTYGTLEEAKEAIRDGSWCETRGG